MIGSIYLISCLIMIIYLWNKILKEDFFSPTQISCYIFLVGAIFALMGIREWDQVYISSWCVTVILLSLIFMAIGEAISLSLVKRKTVAGISDEAPKSIKLPSIVRILNVLICGLAALLYVKRMMEIAFVYGFTGGEDMMQRIRMGLGEMSTGPLIVLLICYCRSLAIVYGYYLIKDIIYLGFFAAIKRRIDFLIVIGAALVIFFISTSRYNFVKYAAILISMYVISYKKESHREVGIGKYLRIIWLVIAALYSIFIITGRSRMSFNNQVSGFDKFIMYVGSPLPCFSYALDHPEMHATTLIGGTTFTGLYSLLEYFGIKVGQYIKFLDAIPLRTGLSSNVYSMQYNLWHDFGYIGLLIIEFFLGIFYGLGYTICLSRKSNYHDIIYSYFVYFLVFQLWNPQIFQDIPSIVSLFEMFFILIFCYAANRMCEPIDMNQDSSQKAKKKFTFGHYNIK